MTFNQIAVGQYFIDRQRRLHQKTSKRCARAGSGPSYRRNQLELALAVPNGTNCPYQMEVACRNSSGEPDLKGGAL